MDSEYGRILVEYMDWLDYKIETTRDVAQDRRAQGSIRAKHELNAWEEAHDKLSELFEEHTPEPLDPAWN
ncbi:hypothetical protein [Trueperella sp. LYQ141]|uniref:hypothetical protein n=1 Tax=Trueperella sp. LYQ141 TaxID=3391058 RepID=UPI0039837BAA